MKGEITNKKKLIEGSKKDRKCVREEDGKKREREKTEKERKEEGGKSKLG
eukprot:GDKH01009631.1.p3 GENE.GDKH01009631.1~~GDKH01009631.1.p3  ORF type:complete len:50 (-),score=5.61 GDKH01009631.1:10-159(-)